MREERQSSERRMKLGDKRCELFVLIKPKKQFTTPNFSSHYNPISHYDSNFNQNNNNNNKFPVPNLFQNLMGATYGNNRNNLFENLKQMNMNNGNFVEMNQGQMVPPTNNNFGNKPPNFMMRQMNGQIPHDFINQPQQVMYPNQNNPSTN